MARRLGGWHDATLNAFGVVVGQHGERTVVASLEEQWIAAMCINALVALLTLAQIPAGAKLDPRMTVRDLVHFRRAA